MIIRPRSYCAHNLTCPIQLILFNQLLSILHGYLLPLFIQQEVQQVSGAHLTLSFCVLLIDHVYFFSVRQQVIEVLDL